jgi:alkanesulfonate monooxygenase SsuD/methylene tetrahydromethanopterin reductase-like flavin-dependent oxidoreductase (luciferase family)
MQLGLFMMPLHPPEKQLAQTYDEDRELLVLADELGYSEAWIGEHATMAWENIPAPDQFIARVFPETRTIRFGTGVVLMAQHHPANTANRVAQLDHLTRGRINFGIGVGRVPTDLELFAIDSQLPELLMFRAIDLILTLWTEDPPYDMPGQFWPIRVRNPISDVGLGRPLKPFQKPHPPIAVPGVSAQSRLMRAAGERGWIPMSSNLVHPRIVERHWDQVAAGAAQAGRTADRSTWRIAREIYVDETSAAARDYVKHGAMARGYENYFFKMFARNGQNVLWKHSDDLPTSELTLEYMIDNMWLVGDPDAVAGQIRELYERVGGFGTLLWVTHDWDEPERWRRSMQLLAHEVMPRLADLC